MRSLLYSVRTRLRRIGKVSKLLVVVFLLVVQVGIGHTLFGQLSSTSTPSLSQVKDVQESLETEGEIQDTTQSLDSFENDKPVISTYTVAAGDTISTIASKFSISTATILWANDLTTKSKIRVGQTLTILPVTGIQYTVKKGDTISGIAATFDANSEEIMAINEFEDANDLRSGTKIIIPDAVPVAPVSTKVAPKTAAKKATTTATPTKETATEKGYYANPMPGSVITQGKHGYNGVDFGGPIGTRIYAAAAGTVIVSKGNGAYNGGYGNYIVIEHGNGTQTLYAHLSKNHVAVGDKVARGEFIAASGNTGRSTGPHLHFEVRGAANPYAKYPKGTRL